MRRLVQSVCFFIVAAVFLGGTAFAAGNVTLLKDKDLPGFDYQVDKGTTLDQ